MGTEATIDAYTIFEIGDAPDAFEGKYPGEMRFLGGPLAAEQVAPHTARSVWNAGPEEVALLIASTRIEDLKGDADIVEDFWPAAGPDR